MPITVLSPAQALANYEVTVSDVDLTDAAAHILAVTGTSLDDHVDVRKVADGSARRAWAIVAGRIKVATTGDDTRAVTSERDGDYSYSEDAAMKASAALSLLAGVPNQLLRLDGPEWDAMSDHHDRRGVPATVDDYGVRFPR